MNPIQPSMFLLSAVLAVGTALAHDGVTPGTNAPVRLPAVGWAAFDVNHDGSVTADEIKAASATLTGQLQSAFLAKYDSVPTGQTAGDGVITTAEAKALFDAQAADWLQHVLETFDTNDDGSITDADGLPARGRRGGCHLDAYDTNEDGIISADELKAAAAEQAQTRLENFLKKYDSIPTGATAGDGVITAAESSAVFAAEIAEHVTSLLDRYDANDDGAWSAAEIAAVDGAKGKGKGGPGGRGRH